MSNFELSDETPKPLALHRGLLRDACAADRSDEFLPDTRSGRSSVAVDSDLENDHRRDCIRQFGRRIFYLGDRHQPDWSNTAGRTKDARGLTPHR